MRLLRYFQTPNFNRHANGVLAIFFVVQIPLALITNLKNSVPYLITISLWALVAGHWSGWVSGRVEQHQADDADVQDVIDFLKALKAKGVLGPETDQEERSA